MAGKRKASDGAPWTPRPPAPRRETENDYRELSPIAKLLIGGSANDAEQSTRVAAPPSPGYMPAMNVMDAYSMFLQRQERELSVNLRGRAARDYARGGEVNEVASPWRFVALSDLIVPQPPAFDQPFMHRRFIKE